MFKVGDEVLIDTKGEWATVDGCKGIVTHVDVCSGTNYPYRVKDETYGHHWWLEDRHLTLTTVGFWTDRLEAENDLELLRQRYSA